MNNIILIGMPAAGKSTIGVILAKELGYQFIDSDLLIQNSQKRLLYTIIQQDGIDRFIEIEQQINSNINADKAVISTGGSVIYGTKAMEHLKSIGKIIYIKLSYNTLKSRLENIKRRGVILKKGQSLYDLYLERCPLYEKYADIIISAENCNLEQTLDKIIKSLTK